MAKHGKRAFNKCLSTKLKGKHCKTKKCRKRVMKTAHRKCKSKR
jgi:hypothetical protein